MRQRRLGSSGFHVGPVGLGCMDMSGAYGEDAPDDDRSAAVIRRALDLGVRLLDTAHSYGDGHNETLLGRALRGRREEAVVATKCGLLACPEARGVRRLRRDGRPEHVRAACDSSLRRLGIDVIDLLQLHRVDEKVPVEETWGAMADLVRAGKVRALGMSEVGTAELDRAHAIHPVASVQSELSLWTRGPLAEVVPWCADHDAAFVSFAPLGRGFLTGAVSAASIGPRDFRARNPRFSAQALRANERILEGMRPVAERAGATLAQVAIAWTLAQGDHIVPIPGTTRTSYLEANVAAAGIQLTPEDLADLDALPEPVGARY